MDRLKHYASCHLGCHRHNKKEICSTAKSEQTCSVLSVFTQSVMHKLQLHGTHTEETITMKTTVTLQMLSMTSIIKKLHHHMPNIS